MGGYFRGFNVVLEADFVSLSFHDTVLLLIKHHVYKTSQFSEDKKTS